MLSLYFTQIHLVFLSGAKKWRLARLRNGQLQKRMSNKDLVILQVGCFVLVFGACF